VERFWEEFMLKNRPVIVSGLTHHWKISREWVSPREYARLVLLMAATFHAKTFLVDFACRL
jgi:hypothetical protein